MATGKAAATEIAKRLNFSNMDVNHATKKIAENSGGPPFNEVAHISTHAGNDIGMRQTHLNYQSIRRVFGELCENAHIVKLHKQEMQGTNLAHPSELKVHFQEKKSKWLSIEPILKFAKTLEERGEDVLQPSDHPLHVFELEAEKSKREKKAVKIQTEETAQQMHAYLRESISSAKSSYEEELAKVDAARKHMEMLLELERQAPPDFRANQDLDEDVEELERAVRYENAELEELEASPAEEVSDEILSRIEDEIAELERSISSLEEERRQAEEKAAAAKKSADARKRWSMFTKMVKGMGGISVSKTDEDGALVVRIVTYLPPGGRREAWPSQTRMHSVSHTLKICVDQYSGELMQAMIQPESVPIGDIVDVYRGRKNIIEFMENVRHRIKVTERRLALLRQAMKAGLQVEYMDPVVKVVLASGDIVRLETSADWPLPRSTLRLIAISMAATRAPSRHALQEDLIGLMDMVNTKPDVERSELVPLVSFIENRLTHLYPPLS